ncbi:DUF4097 family beta strand repeat-containing protein [Pseudoxanthomonas suwonensis]|uniref:Putative auto-transporter adhesin head GIN domain-containing protein n=1 Tax=Pseudoxanthomonas suwonensis TaxID=314722 RepID=A0A0E3Z544_9GAMM|nr:DUF4097 family beta strand repeat-containing protein [Pseudoxanthomonas suwonensis]AKC87792.1 hypothetical protein WQ53_14520 [Pseudoxanthomonas suwonensis]
MRIILTGLLLLTPLAALANDNNCRHSAPRELVLDLAGVKTIRVETHQHDVHLRAAPGGQHAVRGRACASKPEWLAGLTVTQERKGDTLVVRARREAQDSLSSLFGNNYAWLDLSGSVPDDVLVQLVVGSGDGSLEGAAAASADVGSGDAKLRGIRGPVTAKVGSGDVGIDGAGSLKVLSVGSGDIKARNVGGAVEVGSIGSGDFELVGAGGDVHVGSVGSGDADLRDVSGAVRVDSVGSGDVDVRGAASLSVGSIGSGDVSHRDVRGTVDLPRKR